MKEEELKELIGKYYEGMSTDDEERALRAFFSSGSVPPGYETEKEIFSFLSASGDIPEPSFGFEERIRNAVANSDESGKAGKLRKMLIPLSGVAAGLLIIIGSYIIFTGREKSEDTFTDPRIAYTETVKILMDISARLNEGAHSLEPVGKIKEVRSKSMEKINRSASLVEKNLRSLEYLKSAPDAKGNK